MSEFYDDMAAVGLEMIAEFGTDLTFQRTVAGGYNPETGEVTEASQLAWPAKAVILPASQGVIQSFDIRFKDDTLIESNLRSLLVAGAGMPHVPSPGDRVVLEGVQWAVLGGTPLNPTGATPLTYRVTIRRA